MSLGTTSSRRRSSGSKKRGLDYHRRVYRALHEHFGPDALSGSCETAIGWQLIVEPWYRNVDTRRWRQPDAILLYPAERIGVVIEVKLNWKDGRDVKLIDEYLPIVKQAEGLEVVWPVLITQCLRGWQGTPIKSLKEISRCQSWLPGDTTPLMLLP
jgi:hypothetical protein